ncbi:MAG: hypothetical protein A2946_01465 [Candidatus Liptonbacteria bacterium RIFCSPLOWO2_01_FULL_53_13]|uniref:Probable membrane transporter protein n=1 Tax=Candidatus Liptonbacteria bacterium RIFCSPLOWO2_01_FULL_53_13 TaxID=1798651 RepID=A0A1G2CGX7_9BACT|nr:MAG: hypothetical protein A2946_01465 [Candidatus Liptonbacteria bacterium RIFCSPLOWO2_01_FULL_53_13]
MELYGFVLVIFAASILQGITGFGSALIAAPLALLFIDKTTNVLSLTFVSVALNGFLLWKIRHSISRSLFGFLFVSSLVGLPIGLAILKVADIQTLRIVAGSLSILFAALLYLKFIKISQSRFLTILSGGLAGILHTSISMSGPPVVLLVAGQDINKDEARRTFAAFFLAMSLISIALFAASQSLTIKGIAFGICGIPAAFLGAYVGNKIANTVSHKQYTTLTFLLVCITGILAIYSGLRR